MNHNKKILITALLISSCGAVKDIEYKYPESKILREHKEMGSMITGDEDSTGVLSLNQSKIQLPFNQYLWQAALEVISFVPIASTDSTGGIIVTDWYIDQRFLNTKFKYMVMVTSNNLQANGLKVKIYKQIKEKGIWRNSNVNPELVDDIQNKILIQARAIRTAKKY